MFKCQEIERHIAVIAVIGHPKKRNLKNVNVVMASAIKMVAVIPSLSMNTATKGLIAID